MHKPPANERTALPQGTATLPVVEERVLVGREQVATGTVHVQVAQRQDVRPVELEAVRHDVEIERVPVDREVERAEPPWHDGDVLVVPIYEETFVVQRRLVLREELRLHPSAQRRRWTEEVALRRDEPIVERREPHGDPQDGPRDGATRRIE